MPRGRPPKPTRVKELTGNPGKRPLSRKEPKPTARVPKCPDWLDGEAKKKWKELVPELSRLKLLTIVDGDALATYCQAWAEFRQATEELRKESRYITLESGYVQSHPAVAQQRSAWATLKTFAALFGLDPSSRSKLSVGNTNDEKDELDEFLAS